MVLVSWRQSGTVGKVMGTPLVENNANGPAQSAVFTVSTCVSLVCSITGMGLRGTLRRDT